MSHACNTNTILAGCQDRHEHRHGPAGADQYDNMDDWYDDACAQGCTFGNANGTRLAQDPDHNNACVGVWTHAAQRGWLERPR